MIDMIQWMKSVVAPFYSAIHTLPKIAKAVSYYPECRRKSFVRRYWELLFNRFMTRSTNLFYNAYGMDLLHTKKKNYIFEREFWSEIVSKNYPSRINHAVILRDKDLFSTFMKNHGIATPEIIASAVYGDFYFGAEKKPLSFMEWKSKILSFNEALFLKEAFSCCAQGVIKMMPGEWSLTEDYFKDKKVIVQKTVKNCEQLNAIQPNSLNTLRIVTVRTPKTKGVELLSPGGLRVGGGGMLIIGRLEGFLWV